MKQFQTIGTETVNAIKKIFYYGFFAAIIIGIALPAGLLINNNLPAEPVSKKELNAALERTTTWMENNRASILEVPNPILWYRIKEVADLTGDQRLIDLFRTYEKRHLAYGLNPQDIQNKLWRPLFNSTFRYRIHPEEVSQLPRYLQHWAYALHCADDLAELPSITEQNHAAYCGRFYLLAPTCTAHQVTGLMILAKNECADSGEVTATISELQSHLVKLLRYDPRVVDIYVQRALKLVESGAPEQLKNIWLKRILKAQLSDGGWANFDPVIPLGNDRYLGFGYANSKTGEPRGDSFMRGISVGEARSTFHATTQGLMLLALLLVNE